MAANHCSYGGKYIERVEKIIVPYVQAKRVKIVFKGKQAVMQGPAHVKQRKGKHPVQAQIDLILTNFVQKTGQLEYRKSQTLKH